MVHPDPATSPRPTQIVAAAPGVTAAGPLLEPPPHTGASRVSGALWAGDEFGCTVPAAGPRRCLLLALHGLDGFQPPGVLVAFVVSFCLILQGGEKRGQCRC